MLRSASWLVVVSTLLAVRPGGAGADSFDDHLGPREIALGDSQRADARGALAINLNPSGLALNSEMVFEGAYGHRFTDSASALTLSACDSTVAFPGCFYYRYLGASPEFAGLEVSRRSHEGGVVLARTLAESVTFGSNFKYFDYDSDVPGEADDSGFTFDLGVTVRPVAMIAVGVSGHHLWSTDSAQYPRAVSGGLAVRPVPQLGLTFDALWRLDRPEGTSTGRYGGGVEFFLAPSRSAGFPLRGGVVHDVAVGGTYLGAGTGFASDRIGLDVGLRRQVAGGDETVIQASLRLYGPRQVPGTGAYL